MNKKYLNFTLILIVLSVFDVITTQYALSTYPHLSEGNPIMALVASSFAIFVLIKAIGVLVIVNIYKRIKAQSELASKIGQTAIIIMMLFVVGNNLIQIASATTTFGFPAPYELESPGRVETSGEQSYVFIGHNNYNVTEYFAFNSSANGGLEYAATNKLYSNNAVRFAVLDWAHPYRMFVVFANLDVAYTDTPSGITYEDGYYTENVWPLTGCSNCNDLHKIGVLTTLNTKMSGFVDSNGDLILSEGVNIIKFVRSSDYAKITLVSPSITNYVECTISGGAGSSCHDETVSINIDSSNNFNILIGGTATGGGFTATRTVALNHMVYSQSGVFINTSVIASDSVATPYATISLLGAGLLIPSVVNNSTTDYVVGYVMSSSSVVKLQSRNLTGSTDICPTSCGIISDFDGLQIYGGYAYIASSAENKIYRFPTSISVSSGSGYIPGVGTGATATANINYNTKTIQSMYANYYNTSQLLISVNIDADSGFNLLGNNYALNATLNPLSQWYYFDIINPDGVMVKQQAVGRCVDTWAPLNPTGRCTITGLYQFNAPSNGWQGGSWYAKLYESADGGHVALLTTSATWNVYGGNESLNATIISDGEEPITSTSNQATISQIDGYVGLLGFGVNSVSKFLFALIFAVVLFVIGMYYGKSGMIGLAFSSLPYTFFAYISYVPKWTFIIYIILLIVVAKVFR